jgi:tRNA pseudouridine13 synthase
LWGKGAPPVRGVVRTLEQETLADLPELREGLERTGLEQERRALRLRVSDLAWESVEEHALRLSFTLPPGAYATTLLREIVRTS